MSLQPADRRVPTEPPLADCAPGVAFQDLEARSCRWPISGSGSGLRCCGARTAFVGMAYCEAHRAVATRPDPEPAPPRPRRGDAGKSSRAPSPASGRRPLDALDLVGGLPDPARGDGVALADPWG